MTLEELGIILGLDLQIEAYDSSNSENGKIKIMWRVKFPKVETRDSGCLRGVSGRGTTRTKALQDYADELKGQVLVHDAFGDNRREFQIPKTLKGGKFPQVSSTPCR